MAVRSDGARCQSGPWTVVPPCGVGALVIRTKGVRTVVTGNGISEGARSPKTLRSGLAGSDRGADSMVTVPPSRKGLRRKRCCVVAPHVLIWIHRSAGFGPDEPIRRVRYEALTPRMRRKHGCKHKNADLAIEARWAVVIGCLAAGEFPVAKPSHAGGSSVTSVLRIPRQPCWFGGVPRTR